MLKLIKLFFERYSGRIRNHDDDNENDEEKETKLRGRQLRLNMGPSVAPMKADPVDVGVHRPLHSNDVISQDAFAEAPSTSYSTFLDKYVDVWRRNASDAHLESAKCNDIRIIVNSPRDLESANSMEDIVRLLTQRDVLQDSSCNSRGLRLLKQMVLLAHLQDPTKPRWLMPTLLDWVENYDKTLKFSDIDHDRSFSSTAADSRPTHPDHDQRRETRNDEEEKVFSRRIFVKPPELSKAIQKATFKIIWKKWKKVVDNLPEMKLIDILEPMKGGKNEEEQFCNCVDRWIQVYPRSATWCNFLDSVAKADAKPLDQVRALKPMTSTMY